MRNAKDFVEDYRRKGYPDDRIRIIASMRPEPLRSEALAILDAGTQTSIIPPAAATEKTEESTAEAAAETAAATEAKSLTEEKSPAEAKSSAQAAEAASTTASAATEASAPKEAKAEAPKEAEAGTDEKIRAAAPDAEARRALKQEAAARGEREKVAAELKKMTADLAHARADLARLLTTNAEMPALRERAEQLKAAVVEKEKLLLAKERALAEKEEALATLRSEREAAVGRAEKLAATIEGQKRRLSELDALHEKMSGANEELDKLRANAAELKESIEAKCTHIAQVQADLTQTRNEATSLREQIETNGNAIGQLQQKLTTREAELEALRSHFDREAADLKKRAEQEMWVLRRRLRRVHKMAAIGAAVAACFLLVLGWNNVGKSRRISALEAQAAGGPGRSAMAAGGSAPSAPRPGAPGSLAPARPAGHTNGTQPPAPAVVTPPKPVAVAPVLPTVSEPPREGGSAPAPSTPPAGRSSTTVALGPTPSAPPTLNLGSRVVTYTVKRGDTLGAISKQFYNDPTKWRAIAKENNLEGTSIKEGMKLNITITSSN